MIHRFIILINIGIFLAPLFANSEKKLCKDIESTYRAWEKKQNLSYRKKNLFA
ncbi:hypothetical protein HE1_00366 [Holospora elegans E1]|uniref:Uncharacterized protein n=1 Tax=Holospora elegans E1 TaxID=1427503 RepID=A0A023DXE4_9PROT|nr:hypothetical protein HE1_00366 [Holospora elegans E1]